MLHFRPCICNGITRSRLFKCRQVVHIISKIYGLLFRNIQILLKESVSLTFTGVHGTHIYPIGTRADNFELIIPKRLEKPLTTLFGILRMVQGELQNADLA